MGVPTEHQFTLVRTPCVNVIVTLTGVDEMNNSQQQRIRIWHTVFLAIVLLFLAASQSSAQDLSGSTPLGLAPGAPAGSYALSDFEHVNAFNGNLLFNLELLKMGGRGGAQVPLMLPIEQKWIVQHEVINDHGGFVVYADPNWWNDSLSVARYGVGSLFIRYSGQGATTGCWQGGDPNTYFTQTLTRMTFVGPDGTEYELRDQLTGGRAMDVVPSCPASPNSPGASRGKVFVTADGTAATFISDTTIYDYIQASPWASQFVSGYLMLRDGTRYRIDDGRITWLRDRNGNYSKFAYDEHTNTVTITDSLNRRITIEYDITDDPPYGLCDRITFSGFGGAPRKIRISKKNLSQALRSGNTLQKDNQLFPELGDYDQTTYDTQKISAVWLPNDDLLNRHYQFYYNSYGELARVELPTGGAFEYDYAGGLVNGPDSGDFFERIYRRVVERRIYREGNVLESQQTFSRPESWVSSTSSVQNVGYVIIDQYDNAEKLLSESKHYFYGGVVTSPSQGPIDVSFWNDGKEYKTEQYNTNGTNATNLLRRVEHTWEPGTPISSNPTEAINGRIVETITTLADTNQVTKQSAINPYNSNDRGFDQYNNQTDVWDYDFGASAPARHTHTDYLTTNDVNGLAYDTVNGNAASPNAAATIHLRSLPKQVSVFDAGGVERARTTFEYDKYTDANHAALVPRQSISGLCDGTSLRCPGGPNFTDPSYLTRGNPTATTRYLLNSSGQVTGSVSGYAQYDVAGNVVKSIDARGFATTFDFSDRFGAPDGDARANAGSTELNNAGQYSYAFPTLITNALGQTSYMQFDYYLGRPVDAEDANGTTYSGYYNDPLDRPTHVISAVNRYATPDALRSQATFSYDDPGRSVTVTSDQNAYNDNLLKKQSFYDGLGRTTETRSYETSGQYIAVQQVPFLTVQDPDTGIWVSAVQSSNPYRPTVGEQLVWTTKFFDALGRTSKVRTPDGAIARTSYSGNTVTVSDQTGKARKSVSDGLGRLVQVYEDPGGANYLTSYSYDALDDLTTVTQYDPVSQHTQTRSFVYDSFKRLLSATNPENGTANYIYDENGNLLVKTDARGASTHLAYDALNRTQRRWYNGSNSTTATTNNSPALPSGVAASDEVNYFYDAQGVPSGAPTFSRGYSTGRLVGVTYGANSSAGDYFGFDALGRVMLKIQQTGGVNFQTSANYNNGGELTSEVYPSNHTVTYTFNQAGRTSSVSGTLGDNTNRTYSLGISYSSLGGMSQEQFGTDTPIYNKLFYNVRGQLSEIRDSTIPNDTSWTRGAIVNHYSSNCWGMCGGSNSTTPMTDNNGTIKKQDYWIPDNEQVNFPYHVNTDWYTYDSLNRLQKVIETNYTSATNTGATPFQQAYTIDRWGNRTIDQANTSGPVNNQLFSVDPNTNRLGVPNGQNGTMSYDNAGNLTNDTYSGQGQRNYDAENRMTQAWSNSQWQSYTYDANGQRVRRNVGGQETWQVYGIGGELVAEYTASGQSQGSTQNVNWTNAVNVSVSGNNLTKTGGDGWNGGAVSTQAIVSGDGYVDWTASSASSANVMIGLSNGDTDQNYTDIDFAIYLWSDGRAYAYHAAVNSWVSVAYAAGDHFRVSVEGGVVKYYQNGAVWYTSPYSPTYPLLVDTSLYANGSQITNVVISGNLSGGSGNAPSPSSPTKEYGYRNGQLLITAAPPTGSGGQGTQNVNWTNAVGVSVNGNSLTKTAADGWGNAGASSAQTITSGDGYVEFTATENNTNRMLGVRNANNGNTTHDYVYIDYEIYLSTAYGLRAFAYDHGVNTWVSVDYAPGDHFRIAVVGGAVQYSKNGTVFYTSPNAPTYPLVVDSTMYTNGCTLTNVVISGYLSSAGGGADIEWLVTDQLGTPRMIFDKTGSLAGTKRHDYLPFGEEMFANVGIRSTTLGYTAAGNTPADKVRQKFTEQERDDETGLDYMHARYFANMQGRFTSVDPLQASARPGSPQSWNRYSYALNNPLRYSDPSGLTEFDDLRGPGLGNPQDSEEEERHRQQEYLAQQAANEADAAALESVRNGQAGPESLLVSGTYDGAEPSATDGSGPGDHGGAEGPGGEQGGDQDQWSRDSTMVIIWAPAGLNPSSAFGHVSYITMQNDMSYSWPLGVLHESEWGYANPSSDYTNVRSQQSAGVGYVLDFGSKLNVRFQNALIHAYDKEGGGEHTYTIWNYNCGKAFNVAINAIRGDLRKQFGVKLPESKGVKPSTIERYIRDNLLRFTHADFQFPKH
jgi:RHS repeat-associated protein